MTSDKELLKTILDGIQYKASGETDITIQAFDETDIFVDCYFDDDFAQIIINSIGPDTDLRKVARLLDILVWSTPDNGTKLDSLIENWIESNDKTKIEIILLREDNFPRYDRYENITVLERVKQEFPEFIELCNYHIEEFNYQKETGLRRMDILYKLAEKRKQKL